MQETGLYDAKVSENIFRKADEVTDIPKDFIDCLGEVSFFYYEEKPYILEENGSAKRLFVYKDKLGKADDYFSSYGERSVRGNLWKGFSSDGGNLAQEGGVSFKNGKKPLRLIKQLIDSVTSNDNSNITVLDFFAGSGTTGHAVAQLNAEDGGKRRYILCTNNENNICEEVTYQRLENIQTDLPTTLNTSKQISSKVQSG